LNNLNISSGNRKLVVCVFLTLAVLAVFWQVNHYDFVTLDDDVYVTGNSHLQSGFTPDGLRWAFTTIIGQYWHPVTWLSLMLDYKLFGLNAGGYHATNVLLHLMSVLLLFTLFSRMTGEIWKSAFVAAVFALHPLRVESVAWIAKRRDLLCVLFSIFTLLLYVYYVEKPAVKRYLASLFCFVLALMSKPMAVTLPVIMILLDYWPLKRFGSQKGNQILWQIKEKTPFLVLSAVFSVITLYAHADSAMTHFSLTSRIANALVSFVTYPGKIFWPFDLSVLYLFPDNLPVWQVWGSAMLIIAVTAAVLAAVKRFEFLFTGWLWYAVTIAPTIGIIQFGHLSMSDHHAYLPSIGISVMLAWGMPVLFPHENIRRYVLFPAGIAVAVFLAFLTWQQCGYWKNTFELLSHAVKVTKDNYIAHNNLANWLAKEGNSNDALSNYNESIRINPHFAEVYNNRGNVYVKTAQYKNAMADFNEAIRLKPDYIQAYSNRGILYTETGLYQKALEDFNQALRLADISNSSSKSSTGAVLYNKSLKDFNETIHLKDTFSSTFNNRGIVYVKLGEYNRAVEDFSKAVSLKEDCFEAYYNRGRAFSQTEQYNRAIADYNKAIALEPGNAEVYQSLGVVYFKQGDNKSACYCAQKACKLEDCKLLESSMKKGFCI